MRNKKSLLGTEEEMASCSPFTRTWPRWLCAGISLYFRVQFFRSERGRMGLIGNSIVRLGMPVNMGDVDLLDCMTY
jgi:hypothetical protein